MVIQELRGDPADYVELSWQGDDVDVVSIRSGWADQVELTALLAHVVTEVNAAREIPPLGLVRLRVAEQRLGWSELSALRELLADYNAARRSERGPSDPQPAVVAHGQVELLLFGSRLTGIRVDRDWAVSAATQTLSDSLTEALRRLPAIPRPSAALTAAHGRLTRFLG